MRLVKLKGSMYCIIGNLTRLQRQFLLGQNLHEYVKTENYSCIPLGNQFGPIQNCRIEGSNWTFLLICKIMLTVLYVFGLHIIRISLSWPILFNLHAYLFQIQTRPFTIGWILICHILPNCLLLWSTVLVL